LIESLTPFAALVAGLVGSTHCVLMCGGIAGALGLGTQAGHSCGSPSLRHPALYNLGRITSYTVAGGIAGALGGGALAITGLAQLGRVFAALAALVIVIVGLRLAAGARHLGGFDRAGAAAWRRIAPLTAFLFPVSTPARAFGVGLAWGWLPCGMSYAMLAAALLSGSAQSGAMLMAMFGIGTLPAMLALSGGAATLLRPATRRLGGAVLVVLGLASGTVLLWPVDTGRERDGGHDHLHGAAAGGVLVGVLSGQRPQPDRVQDADRLALDFDHAEVGEAREEAADRLDDETEVVREVAP
jgi:sulfite exporter TauE/SafE